MDTAPFPATDHDRGLIDRLNENQIHPVLVFGTQASGKTILLHSLFAYARHAADANITIRLGAPVFPSGYPEFDERQAAATGFFNVTNPAFARGVVPPPDNRRNPFFVPIELDAKDRHFNLAFLEGMGEWYAKDQSNPMLYANFKDEVKAVLRHHAGPLTVILVAPSIGNPGYPRDVSLECLANVVTQYETHRVNRSRDRVLLLATMWDGLNTPDDPNGHFADATPELAFAEISRWPYIWRAFAGLRGLGPNGKAFMPYSGGWFTEPHVIQHAEAYQPIFDRFNRTVWNWLFEAVSSARAGADGANAPDPLYPDVALETQRGPSLYGRLAGASILLRSTEL